MFEPLLRLQDVNLEFVLSSYRTASWRDVFVRKLSGEGRERPEVLHACRDVNFSVLKGERVAVVGANGAGKTSLCRLIAGFYRPTRGRIERFGRVRALFEAATVVQPELTGRENAELLAKLLYPLEDVSAELREALEFSELGRFLDVPLRTYSKGMHARLGLSLATMKSADILVLDEVFDGADQFFREKIAARTVRLMETSGAVIFIHSAQQIRQVCNRVIVLDQGRVTFDGPVDRGLTYFSHRMVEA
jgi:ABC-type polysaccharide/polyol phosphate transport system ATPase subunit